MSDELPFRLLMDNIFMLNQGCLIISIERFIVGQDLLHGND
jgi:hypothetical protein